jgi:hypothetical protein
MPSHHNDPDYADLVALGMVGVIRGVAYVIRNIGGVVFFPFALIGGAMHLMGGRLNA